MEGNFLNVVFRISEFIVLWGHEGWLAVAFSTAKDAKASQRMPSNLSTKKGFQLGLIIQSAKIENL